MMTLRALPSGLYSAQAGPRLSESCSALWSGLQNFDSAVTAAAVECRRANHHHHRQAGVHTMLDHLSLSVADDKRSKTFFARALAPLGYAIIAEYEGGFGIGAEGGSAVWVAQGKPQQPIAHLAFRTANRRQVAQFHEAALAAGGRDNGAPGRARRPRNR